LILRVLSGTVALHNQTREATADAHVPARLLDVSMTHPPKAALGRRTTSPAVLQKRFGANLKAARLAAGLSQSEIERQTAVQARILRAIELGEHNPTLVTMSRLAGAVGEEVAVLLSRRPPPQSKT
jgi:ribosome-binding protein aMBF1 (putative translation factor)